MVGGTTTVTGGTIESTTGGAPIAMDGGAVLTLTNVRVTAAQRAAVEVRSTNASLTATGCTIYMGNRDHGALNISGKNASATIENTVVTTDGGRCVELSGEGASFTMISGVLKVASGGRHVIYSTGVKTATTVYDGYIVNEGTSQAYGADGSEGKLANLTVYGGHFIVLATNGCTNTYNKDTSEDFNNGSYFYGGQVYNYQSEADKGMSFGAAQNVKLANCTQVLNYKNKTNPVNSLYNSIVMNKNKTQLSMKAGAQVRIAADGTNGIRFISNIPQATLDYVKTIADEGSIKYGTAIVPTHYLTDNGLKAFSITALQNYGVTVLKIQATAKGTTETADGVQISAAVVGMSAKQLQLEFSAMPYIEYTVEGNTVYMCGVYDYVDNSRTIADVAEAALRDVRGTEGEVDGDDENGYFVYDNAVEIGGNVYYSCYSDEELEIFRTYAAIDGTEDDYEGFAAIVAGIDDVANVNSFVS